MKKTDYFSYIFDFDYTLGDSTNGIVMCINYAMGKMEFPQYEREMIRQTIGLTLQEIFEQLTEIRDDLSAKEFAKFFKEKADLIMIENTELFADTIHVLTSLKNHGVKTGIVTTKYHYRIDGILEKYKIKHLIDVVVGGEDVINAKPNPEGLLYAIKHLNVPKERVVYIGDSIVDAKTAQGAEVDFIAVTTGTTTDEDFLRFPYQKIINTLSELL